MKKVKQRVLRLLDLGMTLNEQEEYDVCIDFSGYVDWVSIVVYIGKTDKKVFSDRIYTSGNLYSKLQFTDSCNNAEKQMLQLID